MTQSNHPEEEGRHRGSSSPEGAGAPGSGEPADDQFSPADEMRASEMMEEGAPVDAADEVEATTGQAPDPLEEANIRIASLTDDLKRLQAEYVNYKRRVDRDRELTRENATYQALTPITEVMDTIDRAREHGPLDDGLKAVADQLEAVVARQGLIKYGAPGDLFDPTLHEALSHLGTESGIEATTIKMVARSGYKIGDRVVRAAQVLVVDPE